MDAAVQAANASRRPPVVQAPRPSRARGHTDSATSSPIPHQRATESASRAFSAYVPPLNATPNTAPATSTTGTTARSRSSGREPLAGAGGAAACGALARSASGTALMDRDAHRRGGYDDEDDDQPRQLPAAGRGAQRRRR